MSKDKIDIEIKRNSGLHAMVVYLNASAVINKRDNKIVKKYNLTLTQFRVLDTLYCLGTMPINKLLDKLTATSGNMTVVLKNMEKQGLIQKKTCQVDKRRFMIELTPKGTELYEKVLPEHRKEIEELFSILTEEERKQLITILKKFKQYAKSD